MARVSVIWVGVVVALQAAGIMYCFIHELAGSSTVRAPFMNWGSPGLPFFLFLQFVGLKVDVVVVTQESATPI